MKYTRDEAQQGFDVDVKESVLVFFVFFVLCRNQSSHPVTSSGLWGLLHNWKIQSNVSVFLLYVWMITGSCLPF